MYEKLRKAKEAFKDIRTLDEDSRNRVLSDFSDALLRNSDLIIEENRKDLLKATEEGLSSSFIDRLTLTRERIEAMASGVLKVKDLKDPVGNIIEERTLESGLLLRKMTVPIGVICIIFESKPNVAADCAALCFKSANVCILKGGKEAYASCRVITDIFRDILRNNGISTDCLILMENMSHEETRKLMECNEYIDLLIPRGSSRLIDAVIKEARVPVIETGAGICHIYVDESADQDMAIDIIVNAKCSRPSVCNAMETLLVHESIAESFLPLIFRALNEKGVSIHSDEKSHRILPETLQASDEDFHTEYNDLIMNLKIVGSIEEAVGHIERYGTHHSDCIITEKEENVSYFFRNVDSACLYHNASTRFTDGEMFGLGSEIGISTQKLHARGPMGLEALCTYTYELRGKGQIR